MAKENLTAEELKALNSRVNDLFSSVNVDDVSSESSGFQEAPEGYFLCEVKSNDLTLSKSGNPQVAFRFKIVEDGRKIDNVNEIVKSSKGISIFKYYRLVNEQDVKKFVSDMLKFEVDENGNSLPKEAFTNAETLEDALDIINGLQIYVQNTITLNDDGSKSSWVNLLSWKRAEALELPVD